MLKLLLHWSIPRTILILYAKLYCRWCFTIEGVRCETLSTSKKNFPFFILNKVVVLSSIRPENVFGFTTEMLMTSKEFFLILQKNLDKTNCIRVNQFSDAVSKLPNAFFN